MMRMPFSQSFTKNTILGWANCPVKIALQPISATVQCSTTGHPSNANYAITYHIITFLIFLCAYCFYGDDY